MADCPFCGSNKTTVKTDGDGRGWDECRVCGATSGSRSKYDGEEGDEPSDNSFNALNLKIAAARLDGERKGYVKAMRDVESNGLVKNGYVTIPISLLNILKENSNVS